MIPGPVGDEWYDQALAQGCSGNKLLLQLGSDPWQIVALNISSTEDVLTGVIEIFQEPEGFWGMDLQADWDSMLFAPNLLVKAHSAIDGADSKISVTLDRRARSTQNDPVNDPKKWNRDLNISLVGSGASETLAYTNLGKLHQLILDVGSASGRAAYERQPIVVNRRTAFGFFTGATTQVEVIKRKSGTTPFLEPTVIQRCRSPYMPDSLKPTTDF